MRAYPLACDIVSRIRGEPHYSHKWFLPTTLDYGLLYVHNIRVGIRWELKASIGNQINQCRRKDDMVIFMGIAGVPWEM